MRRKLSDAVKRYLVDEVETAPAHYQITVEVQEGDRLDIVTTRRRRFAFGDHPEAPERDRVERMG